VYWSADLARRLKIPKITVIEFGVAGGNGLLALEELAEVMGQHHGVEIRVAGFDMGSGLPPAKDYRDIAHVWGQGFFEMDEAALRKRLKPSTTLLLGDVGDTVQQFLKEEFPPIGFISFDMDYYSSTKKAFAIFRSGPETKLPRVYCHFDDMVAPEIACHNEYVGEMLAIREFNEEHDLRKICKLAYLPWSRQHPAIWHEQAFVFHDFEHPLYTANITPSGDFHQQLRLAGTDR
jgi:hypothetical protein